ncbi:MAG: two-component system response regulator GlrR [Ferrovum sp. 37-45-19]|uniref:sigma 54-interacting transcriptional regulator n=1 Tax=Ferrovum sp. JA12 TaxID=1356299 RepID=UPI000702B6A8|nr:sigma 54-interacting transcriptional regulator [Ferrovum sp. JA12]OYV79895.1 MAG: two-component system response regulator GlrR [Ferrovum sp. 21-44-67]OYV95520.1 MAG: two-component system response regulator GlrR [Ferrovum sp. 37-45-19]HQT81318.1 sigma 54-interacting transcriptional regulator [Ferrovaceae bacterium]KRH78206.1 transcriptional regulatory protein QseF [Ferrovum sp. JA12]HQU05771.1 sigma 54-interacting transcriptional regulator [Ferrovaceae bacterium]
MSTHILLVDDDTDLLRLLTMRLEAANYRVSAATTAEEALAKIAIERPQLVVSDVQLPGLDGLKLFDEIRQRHPLLPVILITAHGTIPDAVEATTRGVFGYLTKPFEGKVLLDKIAEALSIYRVSPQQTDPLKEDWRAHIISRSDRIAELLNEAKMVAQSDASVLIRGESGTGKELLAQAIHRASPRANRPFVALNCSAIPEHLLESELFGHVKGAFTGASHSYDGLLRAADRGTLFLDEIGDMPVNLQAKLLRVLQERKVRPVGSSHSIDVDVRILSSTHQDLEAAIREDQFREDLYYRLNVVELILPPLRERREDVLLLANHFLMRLAQKYHKVLNGFTPDAIEALSTYSWPGNIRQLFNVIEQVSALSTGSLISHSLIQRALKVPSVQILSLAEARERFERDYLIGLLKVTGGNVADAARLAERNRTEFYRLLQKHGLTPDTFKKLESQMDVVTIERQP